MKRMTEGAALGANPSTTPAAPERSPSPFALRENGEDLKGQLRSRASRSCRSISVSVGTKLRELTLSQINIGAAA